LKFRSFDRVNAEKSRNVIGGFGALFDACWSSWRDFGGARRATGNVLIGTVIAVGADVCLCAAVARAYGLLGQRPSRSIR